MAKGTIGSTDIPAEGLVQDLFHIETYIDGLSAFIKECATPMTISIQGDWGSGKTSMMNMIKEKTSDAVHPIWFNTWQFSQFDMGNSLIFSMMEVMLIKLGCEKSTREKILNGIWSFTKKAAKTAIEEATHGIVSTDGFADEKSTNYAIEILDLKEKFQKAINETIKKEKKDRIVVFVDDLDRLQPEKAVELLEVLKLFLDCKNCVFVIAVDYDVVTRGIRQKYGADVSEEKGRSFFDKIIQLPFKVPVAQYDIKNYVKTMLSNMNINISIDDIEHFVRLIQTSIGLNPRSMKRLFNTYQLLDIITKSSIKDLKEDERHKILFAIICMQMGHEKLYNYFSSTPIDAALLEPLKNEQGIKIWINEIFADEKFAENDSKYFNKLIKFITYFYKSIQSDNDDKISESELLNLQSVMKCSSLVSLGNEENDNDASEWDYRYKNRKLAESINEQLSDLGNFKLWLPRKARENVKISDVSSSLYFSAKENFDFTLEYYLSRTTDGNINVYLMLYNKTPKKESVFFETFGENPLSLKAKPEFENWGRIMYNDILIASDANAITKITELFLKAYAEIQKFI